MSATAHMPNVAPLAEPRKAKPRKPLPASMMSLLQVAPLALAAIGPDHTLRCRNPP